MSHKNFHILNETAAQRQTGWDVTSCSKEVMFLSLFVCWSVIQQDFQKNVLKIFHEIFLRVGLRNVDSK